MTPSLTQLVNNPMFWIILGILVFFLWKVPTWKTNIENRLSAVEKAVDNLSDKMDEIYSVIIRQFGRTVEKIDSPVTLSEYGKELFDLVDAEKIVNGYAEKMYNETQGMNAYKVQDYCFTFCKEKLMDDLEANNKDQSEKMAVVAFDQGINMEKITRVVGIALRDRVLQMGGKLHTDVDEYSPNDN